MPDGNFRQEARFLKEKAGYATRLLRSSLTKKDIFIFHRSTYIPAIGWSRSIMTLDKPSLNRIQQKSVAAILQKLGVNRNFPRKVAFGPKELGGMALFNKSMDQGVKQISHFINHCFAQDPVSNLLLIELQQLQLESGSGLHLLENPTEWIPYLTASWITSMWDFMAENNIQLKVVQARLVPLCRAGDRYLMDDFWQLQMFDDKDLYDINWVWTYLQVTTLLDIVEGDGCSVAKEAFKVKQFMDRRLPLRWSQQPQVSRRQCNLWQKAIEGVYTGEGITSMRSLGGGPNGQTKFGIQCYVKTEASC